MSAEIQAELARILQKLRGIEARIGALEGKPAPTSLSRPTVEAIAAYCAERKNGVDALEFFNHYEANGWVRGKTKIRNWKACVHTWEKGRGTTIVTTIPVSPLAAAVAVRPEPWYCGWCKSEGPRGKSWGGMICTECDKIADEPLAHSGGR